MIPRQTTASGRYTQGSNCQLRQPRGRTGQHEKFSCIGNLRQGSAIFLSVLLTQSSRVYRMAEVKKGAHAQNAANRKLQKRNPRLAKTADLGWRKSGMRHKRTQSSLLLSARLFRASHAKMDKSDDDTTSFGYRPVPFGARSFELFHSWLEHDESLSTLKPCYLARIGRSPSTDSDTTISLSPAREGELN